MAIIAVYSPKGGVGKTTLSTDLAWRSARQGRMRTLLWDLDTEGGAGFLLGADEVQNLRSSRVLEKPSTVLTHVQTTAHRRLSYLGLSPDLKELSSTLLRMGPSQRLRDVLGFVDGSFDRVILDCPPVRNELSQQIMCAADLMLVPLPVSPLSARALHHVRSDLTAIGRTDLPILPVFSMYDSRRKAHREAREDWMQRFPAIPYSTLVEQVAFRRRPIDEFAAGSPAALALNKLWRGVEKRLRDDDAKRRQDISDKAAKRSARTGSIFKRFADSSDDRDLQQASNSNS